MHTRDQIAFKRQKVHRVLPCSPSQTLLRRHRASENRGRSLASYPPASASCPPPPCLEPPRNEAAPIGAEEPSSPRGHISCRRAQPGASPFPVPLFWTIFWTTTPLHNAVPSPPPGKPGGSSTDVAPGIEPACLPKVVHATFFIRLSNKAGPNAMSDRLIRCCGHIFHSLIQ
jgi:hypothetical protein